MKRSKIRILSLLSCLALAGIQMSGCLGGTQLAGGSEVTNGKTVVGYAISQGGNPVIGARVWIRPAEYLKPASEAGQAAPPADAVSDAKGRFLLAALPEGEYVLEIRDGEGHAAARRVDAREATTELPADTLHSVGSLEGRLEKGGTSMLRSFVQLQGLDRVVEADSAGFFAFRDLPKGIFTAVAISSSPELGYRKPGPVIITPGNTAHTGVLTLTDFGSENYAAWPFSRKLSLNVPLAGIAADVTDFPVLIRLDSAGFDFALSNGGDLRFAGPDGGHLEYEIERWDPQTKHAEIWVKVDTLRAGTPYDLTLYWGKLDAPNFSQGAAVFSTFAGVWHMGDAIGSGGKAVFRDASPADAYAYGTLLTGDRRGAIGNSGLFHGAQSLKAAAGPGMRPASALTLSAWFMATGTDSGGGEIISLGNNYGLRVQSGGALEFFAFDDSTWTAPTASIEKWKRIRWTGANLVDSKWHQVTGVLAGDSLHVYLDGSQKGSAAFPGKLAYVFGKDLVIGAHGNGETKFDFSGQIDEVEISAASRSRDWIKLAFENQKPGSTLLEFK